MNVIVNRWIFPVISAGMLGAFYFTNEASISPLGLILTTILTLIGIGVIERLDTIIEQKRDLGVTFEENISDLKSSILRTGSNWK